MKTIATFLNPEEAKVARSFLSANGIDAIIAGEESLSVMPHIGMGGKAYQLMVDDEDEAQTLRLLADIEDSVEDKKEASAPFVWTKRKIFYAVAISASLFLFLIGNSESREIDRAATGLGAKKQVSCFTPEFWR